jgi:hypothetical protein
MFIPPVPVTGDKVYNPRFGGRSTSPRWYGDFAVIVILELSSNFGNATVLGDINICLHIKG